MLNIGISQDEQTVVIKLEGRLDTISAPELGRKVNDIIHDTTELIFDFKGVEYVSSAGLRVLLMAQKVMNTKGTMTLINVSDDVMEVFALTKFDLILNIQR